MHILDKKVTYYPWSVAIDNWDKNHYLKQSDIVINGLVSVHKDTDEPCAMNPCAEALRLQDLGINMEEQS